MCAAKAKYWSEAVRTLGDSRSEVPGVPLAAS